MNKYTIVLSSGEFAIFHGKEFFIHDLRNHSVLTIYREEDKKEPVAYFKDWLYFTIEEK